MAILHIASYIMKMASISTSNSTQTHNVVLAMPASARKVRWSVNNVITVKKYFFVLALIKKAMHLLQNYDIWLTFYIYLIIILAI